MARMMGNNKPAYDKPSTIIGEGVVINAELLESKTPVQIAGIYNGDLKIDSSLVITEKARVKGNVNAKFLLLAGEVTGNIDIDEQLHMTSTGRVFGDIICKSLVIDEGGKINGNCKMKAETADANSHGKSKQSIGNKSK